MQIKPLGLIILGLLLHLQCDGLDIVKFEQIIEDEQLGTIFIPAGEFTMGSNNGQFIEKPEHIVYLDAYFIDQNPVTNAEYFEYWKGLTGEDSVNFTPESFGISSTFLWPDAVDRHPNYPVVGVHWLAARAFARWAGKRLPTEAEWEKAARGTDGRAYPWGDDPPQMNDMFRANYSSQDDRFRSTNPVGFYNGINLATLDGDSPYGVNDMAGNVWEWVQDWYQPDYYKVSPYENPRGPNFRASNGFKILRGGSWLDDPQQLFTFRRRARDRTLQDRTLGFRCALSTVI